MDRLDLLQQAYAIVADTTCGEWLNSAPVEGAVLILKGAARSHVLPLPPPVAPRPGPAWSYLVGLAIAIVGVMRPQCGGPAREPCLIGNHHRLHTLARAAPRPGFGVAPLARTVDHPNGIQRARAPAAELGELADVHDDWLPSTHHTTTSKSKRDWAART